MKRIILFILLILFFILGFQNYVNAVDYAKEFKEIKERGEKLLKEKKYNEALSAFSIAYLITEDTETKKIIIDKIKNLRNKEIEFSNAGFGINKKKRIITEALPVESISGEKLGIEGNSVYYIVNIYNRGEFPVQLNAFITDIEAISGSISFPALTSLDIKELNISSGRKNKLQRILPSGQIFFPGSDGKMLLIFRGEFSRKDIKKIKINGLIELRKEEAEKDMFKKEKNKLDKEELIDLNIEFLGM